MSKTVTIIWARDGGSNGYETLELFTDPGALSTVLTRDDPNFATLLQVLEWVPRDNEFGSDESRLWVKWWKSVPIETISHLVKKT